MFIVFQEKKQKRGPFDLLFLLTALFLGEPIFLISPVELSTGVKGKILYDSTLDNIRAFSHSKQNFNKTGENIFRITMKTKQKSVLLNI